MLRAGRVNRPPTIRLFDEAGVRCRNIAALAALLEVCGENTKAVTLAPEFLRQTGCMIAEDVEHLRELLQQLQNELARLQRRN